MRRLFTCLFIIALTVGWLAVAQAEEQEQLFSAGMSMLDTDERVIYQSPQTVEELCEGFVLRITSCMEHASDMSLFIVYGETALPFYVNHAEETVLQYDWTLGAEEVIDLYVQMEPETLGAVAESGHCLNLVLLGLQDMWNVANDNFVMWYDLGMGILIGGEGIDKSDYAYRNTVACFMRIRSADGEALEHEKRELTMFDVSSTQPEIVFDLTDCFEDHVIIPLVNRRLVMQEDGRVLMAYAPSVDGVARGEIVLPLEMGQNEVCFVAVPANGESAAPFSASKKYLITAPEEE